MYDVDSGKLFLVNCNTPGAWGNIQKIEKEHIYNAEIVTEPHMERIKSYYDSVEVNWEECDLIFGDEVFVAPFTTIELNRSSLLHELWSIFEKISDN